MIVTIIVAVIGASGTICAALINKAEFRSVFTRAEINIGGKWYGKSLYIPFEEKLGNVTECIYKFDLMIKQTGHKVTFTETINEFYDINHAIIESIPIREIKGKGRIINNRDIAVTFKQDNSLGSGAMFLTINDSLNEIHGVVAVRNPYTGIPVFVKLIANKTGRPISDKQLGIDKVKHLLRTFEEVS